MERDFIAVDIRAGFVIPRMGDESTRQETVQNHLRRRLDGYKLTFGVNTRATTEDDDSEGRLKLKVTLEGKQVTEKSSKRVREVIREVHMVLEDIKSGKTDVLRLFKLDDALGPVDDPDEANDADVPTPSEDAATEADQV